MMAALGFSSPGVAADGLTSKLRQTLIVSRSKIDEWAEHEKAKADAAASVQQAQVSEQQARIDQAVTHLLALQLEQGLSVEGKEEEKKDSRKQVLMEQKENVQQEIDRLSQLLDDSQKRMQELRLEHADHKERALQARKLKRDLELSKKTTIDDLTRGIVNYKYLGLDFENAGEERIRFCFSQLDPKNPERKFSFELEVEEESWNIPVCDPPLPASVLDKLLAEVEDSQNEIDMMPFVSGMRRAFLQTLEIDESS